MFSTIFNVIWTNVVLKSKGGSRASQQFSKLNNIYTFLEVSKNKKIPVFFLFLCKLYLTYVNVC